MHTMSTYKLVYFPVRGRGESIRLLLKDNKIDYEEENCRDGWVEKYKPQMPLGQVPLLCDGDYKLSQSCAILRYLARKHDLYGSDVKEQGLMDMICDGSEDLRSKYQTMIYTNYENGKQPYIAKLPAELEKFEKLLSKNNGGQTYMVGDK
ncbi:glutathione S-transferase P 1-like, partial [Saccoglossus kowalevskii]|uniref:glutathione transferase n=1 Tax=Saccoglossus kowalevskii TaxID=10224 RepID=A0ABM0MUU8_SACKO